MTKLNLDEHILFEIAKIISNEYIWKNDYISINEIRWYKSDNIDEDWYFHITTNICDSSPQIKIFVRNNNFTKILVCWDYTEWWEEINEKIKKRIYAFLISETKYNFF